MRECVIVCHTDNTEITDFFLTTNYTNLTNYFFDSCILPLIRAEIYKSN